MKRGVGKVSSEGWRRCGHEQQQSREGMSITCNFTAASGSYQGRGMTTGDAIGRPVKFCSLAGELCWTTVVGVVGNVHQYDLEAAPTVDSYGAVDWEPYTVVRTTSDPSSVARGVIGEIHKFDAGLPVTHVVRVDKLLSESVAPRKLPMFLFGLFAGLGGGPRRVCRHELCCPAANE